MLGADEKAAHLRSAANVRQAAADHLAARRSHCCNARVHALEPEVLLIAEARRPGKPRH
jgi:hypothetical protein